MVRGSGRREAGALVREVLLVRKEAVVGAHHVPRRAEHHTKIQDHAHEEGHVRRLDDLVEPGREKGASMARALQRVS